MALTHSVTHLPVVVFSSSVGKPSVALRGFTFDRIAVPAFPFFGSAPQ